MNLNRPLMALTGMGLIAGVLMMQALHFLFSFEDKIFTLFALICLGGAGIFIILCFRITANLQLKASQLEQGQLSGVLKRTQDMVSATRRIKNDQQSLLQLLNVLEDACWILDRNGKFVFANLCCGELLEQDPKALVKITVEQLQDTEFFKIFKQLNGQCLNQGQNVSEELRLQEDGYFHFSCHPIIGDDQTLKGVLGVIRDISDTRKVQKQEEQFQLTDQLTNLGNRNLAEHWLKDAIDNNIDNHEIAVLVMDMDNFSLINKDFGYHQGDQFLKEIGRRLASLITDNCMPVRMNGNQFALLLKEVAQPEKILELANAVQASLGQPVTLDQSSIKGNFSMGMARFPEHSENPQQLLLMAEADMHTTRSQQPAN